VIIQEEENNSLNYRAGIGNGMYVYAIADYHTPKIPPNRCQLGFNSASLQTLPLVRNWAASLDVHMDSLPTHALYPHVW